MAEWNEPGIGLIVLGLAIAAIFFIIMVLVRRYYYPKKPRGTTSKITKEYVTQKFDDLIALRAILAIQKESGILLHSYVPEGDEDFKIKSPEFISGIVHAIRNIGLEMGFKQEFSRLVYGDYHLISNAGQYVQIVLVSRTEPSTIFEDNLLVLIKAVEKKYSIKLREQKSYINTNDFDGMVDLIREVFDTFFIEPLNLQYEPRMEGNIISNLGKLLLDQALLQFKKDNVVTLKKLFINVYGNNVEKIQEKHSRNDVIQEIYTLFKQNYFTFLRT